MTSAGEYARWLKLERRAEMRAAIEVGETSFVEIIRVNGLPLTWPSFEEKKDRKGNILKTESVEVRAQDIGSNRMWQNFTKSMGYLNVDLISLTSDTDRLTEQFDLFLDTACTDRYRNVDMEGKAWRRKIARLAVKYHIMQNKLDGYLHSNEDDDEEIYFVSKRVAYYYSLVMTVKNALSGFAKDIHHIVDDREKAEDYIKKIFDEHYERFKKIPFPQRDDIQGLLSDEDGGADE